LVIIWVLSGTAGKQLGREWFNRMMVLVMVMISMTPMMIMMALDNLKFGNKKVGVLHSGN
jgi:hypothetical protein